MPRKRFRILVLAALTLAACSPAHSGTTGSAAAGSSPSAAATRTASGGGAFCDVVRTSLAAMKPLSEDLLRNPANTKPSWEGIVKQWQTMAAAAPPELRGDFQVIVDSWKRAGDEAAKGGWDMLSLTRALAQEIGSDAFEKAYEHQAQYVSDKCGIEPFNPGGQG